MMAGSKTLPSKGRIQMSKTNYLQIVTSGLQRTAGPYRSANRRGLIEAKTAYCALTTTVSASMTMATLTPLACASRLA
jgi:hypothetical protein